QHAWVHRSVRTGIPAPVGPCSKITCRWSPHSYELPVVVHAPPFDRPVRHHRADSRRLGGPCPATRARPARLVYSGGSDWHCCLSVPGTAPSLLQASVATHLHR